MTLSRFLCIATALICGTAYAEPPKGATLGTIERKDPRFDKLVAPGAVIEKLADGFDWSEGPVWVKNGGYLLFSDIPKNTIWKWKESEGISLYLKPAGYSGKSPYAGREPGSNGLALDSQGRLVMCQHGDRCVARREADGTTTILASKCDGKRFHSPNDLAYKSNGDLYFTDPPYGLPKAFNDPLKEYDGYGVFRLAKDGTVTLLTKELTAPNGIAFSPDEKTLYVANSDGKSPIWKAFPVKADGTLGESRVFFDATALAKSGRKGGCDGLKVDKAGNLWATGPGGVCVFSPGGKHLGTLATGVATANCGWGDDGSTLYITADKSLCRVKTLVKGY